MALAVMCRGSDWLATLVNSLLAITYGSIARLQSMNNNSIDEHLSSHRFDSANCHARESLAKVQSTHAVVSLVAA